MIDGRLGNFCAAGVLFVIGIGVCALSLRYPIGHAANMGAGFYPLVLGILLTFLSVALVAGASFEDSEPFERPEIIGPLGVAGGVVVFGLSLKPLGLGPALLLSTFIATLGARSMNMKERLLSSALVTAFSLVVFVYMLGQPLSVLGPLLGGN